MTQKKTGSERLTEYDDQVRLILESTGEAIYGIDMEGCCTFVNASCVNMLGFDSSDELLNKNIHQLIHHSHADGSTYPIEDCHIFQAHIAGKHTRRDDEVFFRKDGSSFPVEYFSHPVIKADQVIGSVVTFQDISERKEIEAKLARSQETLERAQAIAHIGSWDWDIIGGGLQWSDEIYRIFGLEPQEFGATYEAFLQYIHPEDRDAVTTAVSQTVGNEDIPYVIEHRIVRPDGSERIVNERGKVYHDAVGAPIRMIGTVQDITQQKLAEEKIKRLNDELEDRVEQRTAELQTANTNLQTSLQQLKQAQDQLVQSEKMASLGGLVAGVAHEINTPVGVSVTAISHLEMKLEDYAERYAAGSLTRDDFESLLKSASDTSRIIHQNLDRAAGLIRSFKQVAVDQTSDERRDFNLKEYLQEIMQSLQPKLKSGGHTVTINCAEEIGLYSHPGALSQVMTNLVMNSIIHGFDDKHNGHIRIDVSEASAGTIQLNFSDDGRGIPEDDLQSVFEPFFTTRRGQGGSGLGMHIVFNLVTQTLGGRIQCHSELGSGVSFQITFPTGNQAGQALLKQQKTGS